jgi:Tol biopolymer transport system component
MKVRKVFFAINYICMCLILLTILGCERPVREYTSIFSVNIETKIVTKRCNLGYGYEINYSAYDSYFFAPDKRYFISIAFGEPSGFHTLYYRDVNTGVSLNKIASIEAGRDYLLDIQFCRDGEKITFSQNYIYCVNVDGSALKKLDLGSYPSFSPDGQKVLFLSESGYITLYDLISEKYEQLYYEDFIKYPIFHPNGEKIYFFNASDLKTYRLDNSAVTTIAENLISSGMIKFSNSGDRKVFSSYSSLFTLDEFDNLKKYQISGEYPCISGDGSKIAFGGGSLKVMDFDGSNYKELGQALDNPGIGFSPDDKEVYFINTWKDI